MNKREINYILASDLKGGNKRVSNFEHRIQVNLDGLQADQTDEKRLRTASTMQLTICPTDGILESLPQIAGFILFQDKQDKNGKPLRIFRRIDSQEPMVEEI